MRQWIMVTVIFLLAPWIAPFVWVQARGEAPEARNEMEQAVMEENGCGDGEQIEKEQTEKDQKESEYLSASAPETKQEENGKEIMDSANSIRTTKRVIRIDRGDKVLYRRLEDFLPGVVACQMPDEIDGEPYDPEVWKCQAIIARTYICNLMQRRTEIDEEELDLDYLGDSGGLLETDQALTIRKLTLAESAVKETEGIVMKLENSYILPMFHEMSAGRTRAGGEAFPYLRPVDSSRDTERAGYLERLIFTKKEFAEKISRITDAVPVSADDLLSEVQMVKKDEAGYVEEIKIGIGTYSGDEVRYSLNLPSPSFQLQETGDQICVIVRGRGHGYGMSQSGADSLAKEGWGYEEILPYYYKNIALIFE